MSHARPHKKNGLARPARAAGLAAVAALLLASCGGGNPLSNPDSIENPPSTSGRKLSFVYFQKCINPVFLAELPIRQNGVTSINTCASGGCHDNINGTGGALRIVQTAQEVDLSDAANTPEVIRGLDMYKNFYSAQGSTIISGADHSKLLDKPLVRNVLHGGGLIFESVDDPNAKLFAYWINHPVPATADEFYPADNMFTPDAASGTCNTQ